MKILVVDDEKIMRVTLRDALDDAGYTTVACSRGEEALAQLRQTPFDVAVVDLKMPGMDGLALLEAARDESPETTLIMMTAYGTVETAVEAMKKGAYDYLTKPFDPDELLLILARLTEQQNLREENQRLRQALKERYGFHQLVGKSAAMQRVYQVLDVVCRSDCTVLIIGATGTGKEMVAQAIHYNSERRRGPFVAVSCAALSVEILESELFGHVHGAFTGAIADKKGRFELADKGTLFLDEVDDIPLELQVKLLRVLESGTFERVGSAQPLSADVRIIAAAKVDLRQHIEQGHFRDDLYYRLNQVPIVLSPLQERRDDIPLLIEHFLQRPSAPQISPQAQQALLDYDWPGNVRELKNMIERLVLFHPQRIEVSDLPAEVLARPLRLEAAEGSEGTLEEIMASTEKYLLLSALERTDGNQREAARLLGMAASSLRYRLEHHNLV